MPSSGPCLLYTQSSDFSTMERSWSSCSCKLHTCLKACKTSCLWLKCLKSRPEASVFDRCDLLLRIPIYMHVQHHAAERGPQVIGQVFIRHASQDQVHIQLARDFVDCQNPVTQAADVPEGGVALVSQLLQSQHGPVPTVCEGSLQQLEDLNVHPGINVISESLTLRLR
ncbi:hypothetical protein EYF80_008414 [Liparis tanakae]|uniref:Uncharacterized protein n=1 Tax=Liparis tanakae TaxID=230148 RepID=A0A4Z2IUW2_9TELE|nr:hypothetical protein EYF80_008414 [Liparis tanakae]